jgi:hypothetical protein
MNVIAMQADTTQTLISNSSATRGRDQGWIFIIDSSDLIRICEHRHQQAIMIITINSYNYND